MEENIIDISGEIVNPKSPRISDRELLENIYYHLLAIHSKIDKLGILKYKEMGVKEPDVFSCAFDDGVVDTDDRNLDDCISFLKGDLKRLFEPEE